MAKREVVNVANERKDGKTEGDLISLDVFQIQAAEDY